MLKTKKIRKKICMSMRYHKNEVSVCFSPLQSPRKRQEDAQERVAQEQSCLLTGINCHQPSWVTRSHDSKEGGWCVGFGEGEPRRLGVTAIKHTLQSVEGRKITGREPWRWCSPSYRKGPALWSHRIKRGTASRARGEATRRGCQGQGHPHHFKFCGRTATGVLI